ncbi:sulfur oxidation c-type cytochrome SoxX [Duganella sp. Root1480D1]|uniref:sulfur oxidation c-type cytochrome SoxX n=1 Tax=Duganella sp. Root1480D1 TaxID=1736471 RepID=UPI001E44BB1E|nr:sulfur oxidation c-type cytochrome SoxX [Duganella sp. Root1480D1]
MGLTLVYRFSLAALLTLNSAQAQQGNPKTGREIVANRQLGLCLLCHPAPIPEERFQGNLAPDLAGVGSRHSPAEIRQRINDSSAINPSTIMPAYHKTTGLTRLAPSYRDKPILTEQQIEDVVAYLATLREEKK